MKNKHGLTQKQEKFAQGVASGLSQADAYRAAYPVSLKWKGDSVHNAASALMRNALVLSRVKELSTAIAEKVVDDAALIVRENLRLAQSRISGIMHPDGRVKLPHELDPETEAAIASFKIDEYGRIEYRFWDKNSALERGAKIVGLFKKDNEQKTDPMVELARAIQGASIGPVKSGA